MEERVDVAGRKFKPGHLIKYFHFVGRRNKKHFMYKLVMDVPGLGLRAFDVEELATLGIEKAHMCRLDHLTTERTEILNYHED